MPSLCGGPEGAFAFTGLMSISFKMNLDKAQGIKPNSLINLRFLLEPVSLRFFSPKCIFWWKEQGEGVSYGVDGKPFYSDYDLTSPM